jgi:hypothetical protein
MINAVLDTFTYGSGALITAITGINSMHRQDFGLWGNSDRSNAKR